MARSTLFPRGRADVRIVIQYPGDRTSTSLSAACNILDCGLSSFHARHPSRSHRGVGIDPILAQIEVPVNMVDVRAVGNERETDVLVVC